MVAESSSAGAFGDAATETGFVLPYLGTPQYAYLSAPKTTEFEQTSRPIGQALADQIAAAMGFPKADSLTNAQYLEFVSGIGTGGDPARAVLLGQSVNLFINNRGFPLFSNVNGQVKTSVLSSFGLMVDPSGKLQSLANASSPSKQVNADLAPGSSGYMGVWCRQNGCQRSIDQLYLSAYTGEVVLGYLSQENSEPVQIVANTKDQFAAQVGMSMIPPIWLVNFILLYVLNPNFGAMMPSFWTPIPANISKALIDNGGQIDFSRYESELPKYEQLLRVLAGNGTQGSTPPSNGPARDSALSRPGSSAVDAQGNVYIADTGNNVIVKVTPSGVLSVIAGGGATPPSTSVTATTVQLSSPSGVAVDALGNVYIADTGNNLIEKVTPLGSLSVIAGGGATTPAPLVPAGLATAAQLSSPHGVAVDAQGNVYIADTGNNLVEEVDLATGNLYVLAGGGTTSPMATQLAQDWDTHSGLATNVALSGPKGVAVDGSGVVYVADTGNNIIGRIACAIFNVVAGGGTSSPMTAGPATATRLNAPQGIAIDLSGSMYVTDTANNVVERIEGVLTPAFVRPAFTG